MFLAQDFRRQAHVCARLADDCDDLRLAERLRAMASDLLAKAEDLRERQACSAPHNKDVVTTAATDTER
jgi:hypothetical protein